MLTMQWLMLLIFIATFIGLIKYQQTPEKVFAVSLLACLATGLVSADVVLNNVVNPGLVTLVLLVLCSFAFERTSVLRRISVIMIKGSPFKSTFKTLLYTAFASALMNNTAVVAALISTIKKNTLIKPSKLLLPVSYAAILGGTLTLVGTSTNLIVNSLFIEQGANSLGFFDFTFIGFSAFVICLLVILATQHLLPNLDVENFSADQYLLEAEVSQSSKLVGITIEGNGLRNLDSLFLAEIVRGGRLISPVCPDEIIQASDKLIFTGDISKVLTLQQFDGLTLFAEKDGLLRDNLTEVLIKPDSAVIGKNLKKAGFRARFDAAVVAIRREGTQLSGKLGDITIQSGDFLVLAVGNDFSARTNLSKNFFILSGHKPDNMLSGWRDSLTVFGFLVTIACSVMTNIALLKCLMFYIAILVLSGCLTVNEIKRRFPLEIWMVVLGALTLAKAFETSGIAALLAQQIELLLQGKSAYLAMVCIFIITLLMTEIITNSAAAALVFPIAYSIALGLGVNPLPFVMAVAFGASGSFISPYGYQTNMMVFNAGNYRLIDVVKFGLPVSIAYSIVVLLMIPVVFPF
ncbi:SLC13 family permease [Colwellia sp. MB3u-22]|nr:SLC13 family permease [Colwellia sp. MB02u-7]MBA6234704.1 SLC13 family permease [Colwellia sp. MB02u-11]MBA6301258.1 SLC13 family permease [Colwellia sp. MB3u-22]MBA6313006.1 SLC13 family permease [Colwellia sp. MB3u-64]